MSSLFSLTRKPIAIVVALAAAISAVLYFVIGTQDAGAAQAKPQSTSDVAAVAAAAKKKVKLPPANAKFDYQLGGAYKPPAGVKVVTRDSTAKPAKGAYNICYVNAFQAQPGAESWWKKNHPELLLKNKSGKYVVDGDWDELILDISTAAKRKKLAGVVGKWFDGCAKKGYQAVEPDNLDSYTRSQKLLKKSDAVAFSKLIAARAHKAGLAIGQKNTMELGKQGKKAGFDFAVSEECGLYDECGDYTKVYGKNVIVIEYTKKAFTKTCKEYGSKLSVVRRDLDVTPKGSKGYVYQAC
ncbi:endo alpha-1,4 polygalactosaminidase [Kineosporia babensis]|uniref:Endo alpha-1,4 polygalactosaminidase n=1 Tax=Kineosporia babensis TaxID=499548 RepID=A0A9X1NKY9_9ACTN|nr:endo alpha-1,4 polygalactosaminidase [Kineosporia babensis]